MRTLQKAAAWFPEGDIAAAILTYDSEIHEIGGCGDMAFARGRLNELTYEYQGKTFRQGDGNHLTLFRRDNDGTWHISHRIWNDPPIERD